MIPSCGVRSGRGTGGVRGEALKPGIALAEDCKGPLRSARPRPSPRLDLSRQGSGAQMGGGYRSVRWDMAGSLRQGSGQWERELPFGE